jgi:hypothetical protein
MPNQERRLLPRHKTLLAGSIHFTDKQSVLDCLVRELGEDGARLRLPSTFGVPEVFDLDIPQLQLSRRCRVAWSTMQEIGVAFGALPASDNPASRAD